MKRLKKCGSKWDKHLLHVGVIHPAHNSACGRVSVVNVAMKRADKNSSIFPGSQARLLVGVKQCVSSPALPAWGVVHLHQSLLACFERFQADFPPHFSHPSRSHCGVSPAGAKQLMDKFLSLWSELGGAPSTSGHTQGIKMGCWAAPCSECTPAWRQWRS